MSDNDCAVCLEKLAKGTAIVTTQCGHSFHFACLQQAALKSSSPAACPLCREDLSTIQDAFRGPSVAAPAPEPAQAVATAAPAVASKDSSSSSSSDGPVSDRVDHVAIQQAAEFARSFNAQSSPMRVDAHAEVADVAFGDTALLFGTISIKAPPAAPLDGAVRAPLDIVIVVDKSGSMSGEKMQLLKSTLAFVLRVLTPADRLSLVKFSSRATVLCPLWRCDDHRKQLITDIIGALNAEGGTDIAAGLLAGLKVLTDRSECNSISSVLLLTDGQDTKALGRLEKIVADVPRGTSVHSFGFGADHDAKVMSTIAERCSGSFTFIAELDDVARSFAATLGGLSSTVATDIDVLITCGEPGFRLCALHTKFPHGIAADERSGFVKINDLFGDEERDVVFSLFVPQGVEDVDAVAVKSSVTFLFPGDPAIKRVDGGPLVLRRPAVAAGVVDLRVNVQRNRVRAAAALDDAARLGEQRKFDDARECLNGAIAEISASASAGERLVVSLLADLRKACNSMQSFDSGGYATVAQMSSTHNQQRQTVTAEARTNDDDNVSYGYNSYQNAYFDQL